ncbi:MAG: substrate-binding domain-containing protein [Saprospiraceae bacterium]|nr:substrate-binding domain-containing protein [Saprospiraceae bacterium]
MVKKYFLIDRFLIFLSAVFINTSCQEKKTTESTPTKGYISIACDQQIRNIMEQEEDIFEKTYKYASLNIKYENESTIYKMLGTDSIKTIISCRPLNNFEIKYFNSKQIHPRSFPFAIGALALLTSKEQKDSTILFEDFINLCKGHKQDHIPFKTVLIEDVNSGIARYILEKIQADSFASNVYTLPDKDAILNYLEGNPKALAIVDWLEFSDSDDTKQQSRLKELRVLGITRPKDSIQIGFLLPDQYLLQDQKYPLSRTLYFISCSGKSDLGLGFASFVTGEIGQKILLKAGLLPIFQTERWIELKSESFKVVE